MQRRHALAVDGPVAFLVLVLAGVPACHSRRLEVVFDGSAGGSSSPGGQSGGPDGGPSSAGSYGGAGGAGALGAGGRGGAGGRWADCSGSPSARVPVAPLRALDDFAYRNTLHDLLAVDVAAADLPDDAWAVSNRDITAQGVSAYHLVAHDQAVALTRDSAVLATRMGCDLATAGEATCLQRLLDNVVARLFRRPLEPDDVTDFNDVFAQGRAFGGTFASGARAVLEVALQSPEFLYRVEWGENLVPAVAGVGRPRPFEMAARLSYLLWGAPPDDALWNAAAQGRLRDAAAVATEARRMLLAEGAKAGARHFFFRWMGVPEMSTAGSAFDLAARAETGAFLDDVLWRGPGDLATLLSAPWSYVNELLAGTYGLTAVTGADLRRTDLPASQRRGLFTQAAFLAARPSLSGRALALEEGLLCGEIADPTTAHGASTWPPLAPTETRRQHLARVTAAPGCQTCHAVLAPFAAAFAHYDDAGAWRDTEGGMAIDSAASLDSSDVAGPFDGAPALMARLATSQDVRACHVRRWMEAAYGRPVGDADACTKATLESAFAASGGNIRDLLFQLTQTEAFLLRPLP